MAPLDNGSRQWRVASGCKNLPGTVGLLPANQKVVMCKELNGKLEFNVLSH